jgi:phosphohistidine phosphatase SixA
MPKPRTDAPPPSERFVVLLRHEAAEETPVGGTDEDRILTAEGHARMKKNAQGLARVLPRAQAIYSSPLVRATQTALWVARAYRSRIEVTQNTLLAPGSSLDELLDFVRATRRKRIILVGHEPELGATFRALTGVLTGVQFRKGGAIGIRLLPDGSGILDWILPPEVLKKLAD